MSAADRWPPEFDELGVLREIERRPRWPCLDDHERSLFIRAAVRSQFDTLHIGHMIHGTLAPSDLSRKCANAQMRRSVCIGLRVRWNGTFATEVDTRATCRQFLCFFVCVCVSVHRRRWPVTTIISICVCICTTKKIPCNTTLQAHTNNSKRPSIAPPNTSRTQKSVEVGHSSHAERRRRYGQANTDTETPTHRHAQHDRHIVASLIKNVRRSGPSLDGLITHQHTTQPQSVSRMQSAVSFAVVLGVISKRNIN